jgi:hypothetical protein
MHVRAQSLGQLDELEDEVEERTLDEYRKKRIAELQVAPPPLSPLPPAPWPPQCLALRADLPRAHAQAQAVRNRFGDFVQINEPEFIPQVSKAGKDIFVVVHLFVHRCVWAGAVSCLRYKARPATASPSASC